MLAFSSALLGLSQSETYLCPMPYCNESALAVSVPARGKAQCIAREDFWMFTE